MRVWVVVLIVACAAVLSFSFTSIGRTQHASGGYQIGDVVSSFLDLQEFRELHREGVWMPLDGRSIDGTRLGTYASLQQGALPNAGLHNGLVLRGMDAERTRRVGDVQPGSVGSHQHVFLKYGLKGDLRHWRSSSRRDENNRRSEVASNVGPFVRALDVESYRRTDLHPYGDFRGRTPEFFAEPEYQNANTIAMPEAETRAASLTVNFYVRVD